MQAERIAFLQEKNGMFTFDCIGPPGNIPTPMPFLPTVNHHASEVKPWSYELDLLVHLPCPVHQRFTQAMAGSESGNLERCIFTTRTLQAFFP